jgi:DNA-binding MarR family transcriptional regulator
MPQLSERESQLPHLVTAGEMMQKLTPIRLATLSYLSNNDIETQNEIADALGVSPTTVTTHLQLLSDLPRPLTIRKRRYEITSDGDAVIKLYDSMFRRLDDDFDIDDLTDEAGRETVGDHLAPIHETRSIAPFLVLYSVGHHSTDEEIPDDLASGATAHLERVLDDVKDWEEDRGKTASRKQVRRILQRFEEFDVVEFAGDWITILGKGEEHIRLLEEVLHLLEGADSGESEPPSAVSQQVTADQVTRSDTGGTGESPMPSQSEQRDEDAADSPLPAIVPAYRVVTDDKSPAMVLPLTSTTNVEDMSEQIEYVRQEYGNARLEFVWTDLHSETDEAKSARDSRLKPR